MTDVISLQAFTPLPFGTILLVLLGLVFIVLIVVAVLIIQFGTRLRYLASPVYDRVVKEAEEKAEQILEEAREHARTVKAHADDEAETLLAARKKADEEFHAAQMKHLEELSVHAKELLTQQTLHMTNFSEQVTGDLKTQITAAGKVLEGEAETMKRVLEEETGHLKATFSGMGQKITEDHQALIAELKKKMTEELDAEIAAARTAVSAYRSERIALLNKEIVGLVEETAKIALHRSLTLEEHRDLILAALEEAKQQGVFAKTS